MSYCNCVSIKLCKDIKSGVCSADTLDVQHDQLQGCFWLADGWIAFIAACKASALSK